MKELFDRVKAHSLARYILRYILGILFIVLGLFLGIYVDIIWLYIGIILCMLQSVILIAGTIRKSTNRDTLIKKTFNDYLNEFKPVVSSKKVMYAIKYFGIDKATTSYEAILNYSGEINNIKINHATIKCRINGCGFDDYFARIYIFECDKAINADINLLRNKYLINYRYEIKDNMLYLITLSSHARGRMLSLYPIYYKNYEQWILRLKDEDMFIKQIVELIGGNN